MKYKILFMEGFNSEVKFFEDRKKYELAWAGYFSLVHSFKKSGKTKNIRLRSFILKDGKWHIVYNLKG